MPSNDINNTLSPYRSGQERSASRPSSRTSLRTHSPSFSLDDPVAVRNQVSTLKHSIRQQQAKLNTLEGIVRSGPRGLVSVSQPDLSEEANYNMAASSSSSPPSSYVPSPLMQTPVQIKRRSSHDVLLSLAGPDSGLPLPKQRETFEENGIREGVPMDSFKRSPSPSKSRIPISAVGHARALADEGTTSMTSTPRSFPRQLSTTLEVGPGDTSMTMPTSPNKRMSLTPGGTTKVLADLQAGVVTARNALENTKTQLRLSQRSVAQLTRQTEDLKEGRERLRLENEGLNNVVARKERLLQEVLERARKAEAEAATLKSQLKSETTVSKKTIREMEAALAESTALSQKSEREYITLRDSLKSMNESFKNDLDRLRDEMKRREDRLQAEGQKMAKMYKQLVAEVQKNRDSKEEIKSLKEENQRKEQEVAKHWQEEIEAMRKQVEEEGQKSEQANKTATHLAEELARLRRLMRHAGRRSTTGDDFDPEENVQPTPPP
ncbi:hypothetical protein D9619_006701 [Psilocybe cf. subviscida]|uniref:SWI5-dependent HO expression protein 3 n=1 Tax=Psilocybe cf. subviscida TaxID=2480587 RepID=A0A8H5B4G0_9AGAR|nr:hypothetical protein D9619_006701 [Psilocybe cf. subviscida]